MNFGNANLANIFLNMMMRKITIPKDYHGQVDAIKLMLTDDMTGLVDSLGDFAVQSASVKYNIDTDSEELNKQLKKWLKNINSEFAGKLPRGINALAKEYFKERWKSSSFPILKILEWGKIDDLVVPTKMAFVDGGSVYSKDLKETETLKQIGGYDYYLGSEKTEKEKLDKGVIFTRPFCRWFDEYPVPFLIKRGIYHNWKLIESIKETQSKVLDQIIPYFLSVKKGTEQLAIDHIKVYDQSELDDIVQQFQEMINEQKRLLGQEQGPPVRVSQFDEEIKHEIPDLNVIMEKDLFASPERGILSGWGFIDIVEATSTSRRESILNPKGFIKEVKTGVEDFRVYILEELVAQIIEKNKTHTKYMAKTFHVTHSPVVAFMTDKFKQECRQLWNAGKLSAQTAVEIVAEVDFETEVYRREQEKKNGIDEIMYPPITQAQEQVTQEQKITPETDENGKPIPDDKRDPNKKREFNQQTIENIKDLLGSPYKNIKALPDNVKELPISRQRSWLKIFNKAYAFYLGKTGSKKEADKLAVQTAWGQIKKEKE